MGFLEFSLERGSGRGTGMGWEQGEVQHAQIHIPREKQPRGAGIPPPPRSFPGPSNPLGVQQTQFGDSVLPSIPIPSGNSRGSGQHGDGRRSLFSRCWGIPDSTIPSPGSAFPPAPPKIPQGAGQIQERHQCGTGPLLMGNIGNILPPKPPKSPNLPSIPLSAPAWGSPCSCHPLGLSSLIPTFFSFPSSHPILKFFFSSSPRAGGGRVGNK